MKPPIPIKDSWKFCPRCGTAATSDGCHPFACLTCNYHHYFSPCTAVGALIVDAHDQMLFIVRGKKPGKGKLGLPGGFVDASETAEAALIREVKEELNLIVTDVCYLASFPNQYAFSGVVTPVTDLFYVARVEDLTGIAAQDGEIEDWKFMPAADVDPTMLAFDTHQKALTAFLISNR